VNDKRGVRLSSSAARRLAKTNMHVERRPRGGDGGQGPPRPRFPQGATPGKMLAYATSGAIVPNASSVVTLAVWSGTALSVGSDTLTVWNPWNFTVLSGSLVAIMWYYGAWFIDAANCS
jgi:hypothetical protein